MGFFRNVLGGPGETPGGEYGRCGWCAGPIRYGETSVAVNLNTERAVGEGGGTVVDVLESDVLLVLCEPCGGRLDAGALRRSLEDGRPS